MANVDKLINTNFDFNILDFNNISTENLTEFKKIIIYSEDRYKIKEYI